MLWYKLRLSLSLLLLIIIFSTINRVFENFENCLMRKTTSKNEEKNTAFSFCTDFEIVYMNCLEINRTKHMLCNNLTGFDCNRVLFEGTQTSFSLFSLIKKCNLMTLLDVNHNNTNYSIYVNFGMVCHLFPQKSDDDKNRFLIRFNNLNDFKTFRIYLYIHEYSNIPEYLNHYVHLFDTSLRGHLNISFSKKIIYRHLTGSFCTNYGGEHK